MGNWGRCPHFPATRRSVIACSVAHCCHCHPPSADGRRKRRSHWLGGTSVHDGRGEWGEYSVELEAAAVGFDESAKRTAAA